VTGAAGEERRADAHRRRRGHTPEGPSDHPDLAEWLLEQGIGSLSPNQDTVVETWQRLAKVR
jgi:pyruvate,water dikinase